ncbi:steryl-sulfatase [Eucyclogobius newberryi]|uniref:steryl-sulfatase n=1 Tax=Eucyclogobius newberryi TaxID=166745 RepID=UPI003B59C687
MRSLWVFPQNLFLLLILVLDPNQIWCLDPPRPNFVLMMVDDLGIGDLGCYGNKTLKTPHIDSLASQGVKLTHHIAAAPLCSPSRAAFLTGRYPIRSGVYGTGLTMVFLFNAGSGGLPQSELTFASIAQKQGYETALIGKWHLGLNCENRSDPCHHPNKLGFKYFFGIPLTNLRDCHPGHGTVFQFHIYLPIKTFAVVLISTFILYYFGLLPRVFVIGLSSLAAMVTCFLAAFLLVVPYMNCILMRNGEIVEQPFSTMNLTQRMTQEAVDFMERSAEKPFLLLVNFLQVHTALFTSADFRGSSSHGLYGDAVHEVDWSVGQILQTLDRLGLSGNTVVYLTSDQGAHLEEVSATGERHGGSNGIYKAGKSTNFEGGIRVPGLVRWSEKIPPGLELHKPTSNMDLFPTVVQLSRGQLPQDRVIDGRPLVDLLLGESQSSPHEFLFHYCSARLQAVRWSPQHSDSVWKVFYFTPNFYPVNSSGCYHTHVCFCSPNYVTTHNPPLLYDLSLDPSESRPLGPDTEPDYHHIIETMAQAVRDHRASIKPRDSEMSVGKLLPKPWLQPCCSSITQFCQCQRET